MGLLPARSSPPQAATGDVWALWSALVSDCLVAPSVIAVIWSFGYLRVANGRVSFA